MRSGELLPGELVQARREPFGQPAGVHEHDRRAVRPDQLEQLGVDRGPDRRSRRRGARRRRTEHQRHPLRRLGEVGQLGHVLDRDDDLDLHRLAEPRVHDGHRPGAARGLAAEEPGDLLERALGRRQADPLRRLVSDLLEAFEREREVRAALGAGHRVDLVDDHPSDAAQDLARLRREHQVEGLGRRDQDVGWARQDPPAFGRGRVAGSHRDAWLVDVLAEALGRQRRSRRAAPAGSSRCRPRALAVGRCRGPGTGGRWAAEDRSSSGRAPTGTRRASCPNPSARGSGCAVLRRSPASPGLARRWASRTCSRTTLGRRGRTPPGSPVHGTANLRRDGRDPVARR